MGTGSGRVRRPRVRWPEGTWMRLKSAKLLIGQMDVRNLTQYSLAQYAGCNRSMISHLVSGRKRTCSPELATRISEVLGVALEALFDPSNPPVERKIQSTKRTGVAA